MALEPLTTNIIFELMYISIGLVILGYILNWILGLKPEIMKEIRDNARNLQERLRQAQILGDELLMFQLQQETMTLMKQMLKKQLAPMLIRCVIFLGIFAILSFYYGRYEFWFWVYFAFSLSFSLLAFGLRKLYLKITGKETKREKFSKELFGTFTKTQQGIGSFHLSGQTQEDISNISDTSTQFSNEIEKKESNQSEESENSDSWKNRIKN